MASPDRDAFGAIPDCQCLFCDARRNMPSRLEMAIERRRQGILAVRDAQIELSVANKKLATALIAAMGFAS